MLPNFHNYTPEALSDAGEALNVMWELLTQSDNNPGDNQPACAPSDPSLEGGRFSLGHLQCKKFICIYLFSEDEGIPPLPLPMPSFSELSNIQQGQESRLELNWLLVI